MPWVYLVMWAILAYWCIERFLIARVQLDDTRTKNKHISARLVLNAHVFLSQISVFNWRRKKSKKLSSEKFTASCRILVDQLG